MMREDGDPNISLNYSRNNSTIRIQQLFAARGLMAARAVNSSRIQAGKPALIIRNAGCQTPGLWSIDSIKKKGRF